MTPAQLGVLQGGWRREHDPKAASGPAAAEPGTVTDLLMFSKMRASG